MLFLIQSQSNYRRKSFPGNRLEINPNTKNLNLIYTYYTFNWSGFRYLLNFFYFVANQINLSMNENYLFMSDF